MSCSTAAPGSAPPSSKRATGRVNSRSRSEREVGMRFGAGVEFPLSGSLSGRMEYGLISFPDYDFGPVADAEGDNFASIANVASFGLVYNFGAVERTAATPVEFGGFYAGVEAGHGALSTENRGPRDDPAQPFVLTAERAGMGASGGIYAGYGKTFGQLYLGAEVEAELANAGWDIERDPNGRVYSVEKQGSVGAAVRAGYVIGDAVLLYGRAGVANSWFKTDYAFEGVNVSRDIPKLACGWAAASSSR